MLEDLELRVVAGGREDGGESVGSQQGIRYRLDVSEVRNLTF